MPAPGLLTLVRRAVNAIPHNERTEVVADVVESTLTEDLDFAKDGLTILSFLVETLREVDCVSDASRGRLLSPDVRLSAGINVGKSMSTFCSRFG